jgi:hypothetical protein
VNDRGGIKITPKIKPPVKLGANNPPPQEWGLTKIISKI